MELGKFQVDDVTSKRRKRNTKKEKKIKRFKLACVHCYETDEGTEKLK